MPRRVFLKPTELVRNSRHHTAYTGAPGEAIPGQPAPLYRLEFVNGVARNVDEQLYERFKDVGIADVSRPKRPRLDDEDDED